MSAWRSLEPLLVEDIEQNLEYWHSENTHYVRIPWQLYLLALASEYSPWRFATFRAQRRLHSIITAIRSDSFRYQYSGTYLSSRTNGIAYDALTAIKDRVRHFAILPLAYMVDQFRVFAGSRAVRYVIAAFSLLIIAYSIMQWWTTGHVAELAPHFIVGFILFILAWSRR